MKKQFYLSTAVHKLDELIKLDGYKPKSKFGGECTSLVVEQQLRECEAPGAIKNDRINELLKKLGQTVNSKSLGLPSKNCNSLFYIKCREVVANHHITPPAGWKLKEKIWNYQLGFLAALVKDIISEEKAPPKGDLSHLGYIGDSGKRGNFFVKMTEKVEKDDYVIHKVVDKTGNRGWFYNYKMKDPTRMNPKIGDCFLMTATPSRQEINKYDGGKHTYFNRITVLENKGSE